MKKGCRNHNRIWECNLHNCYLLKISFYESVSSQSFSWRRETLWHLDFMVYVFLFMWIFHNHNQKIMFVTNSNSYGQNLLILNFLPSRVPPLLPSYLAAHLFQSMYFHWIRCLPYAVYLELVELICIITQQDWHRNRILSTR